MNGINQEEKTEKNYYAVAVGKKIGIFKTWGQCHKQTNRSTGALFAGFITLEEAVEFLLENTSMERDAILVFNGRGQSMPLNDYCSGTDDHDDSVTVPKLMCESG